MYSSIAEWLRPGPNSKLVTKIKFERRIGGGGGPVLVSALSELTHLNNNQSRSSHSREVRGETSLPVCGAKL